MTRRRIIPWAIGGAVVLAFAFGLRWRRPAAGPQLPAAVHYGNLPDRFNQALQAARDQLRSPATDAEGVRKLARLYQANRLFAEARTCYRLIESTPAGLTARDHYYLADIAQNENDLVGAQTELRSVLQLEPRYVPARLALAEALFKTGHEDEAAREYSAILAIEADHPEASLGLVRLALQRGDDESARLKLEQLVARHPESTSAAALLARLLGRRGEAERAAALTRWSQQRPDPAPADPWLETMLVDCYDVTRLALKAEECLTAGQMARALPYLDRIDDLDSGSWLPPILRGWSHERAGRHVEAVQEYRLALQRGGNPERICPLLAAALLAAGQATEAARMLAEYHAKLPDSIPILRSYAEVAVKQGDDPLARTLLAQVLQAEPYSYMPAMSLAGILWNAGEHDAAAQILQRIARVFPADVDSRELLGRLYLEKMDPWSAVGPLEQAVAQVETPTAARTRLTTLLASAYLLAGSGEAEKGRFAEAVDFAGKASRLVPADVRPYALKANVCLRLKDFGRAADALEKMAALEPANATIHFNLGDAVYRKGDAEMARRYWTKARELAGAGDDDLKAALEIRLNGHITDETFK